MAKNIVFCADGTWNGPGEPDQDDKTAPPTNVFKLFLNLAGQDTPDGFRLEKEQERAATGADGTTLQIAKYLDGVGDSDNFLVQLLGGSLGAGLITRIVRGYSFISRNYRAGDRIYICGFSRGAYTARALAGMIAAKGLLDATCLDLQHRERGYRLGAAVWYRYRRDALQQDESRLGRFEEMVLDLPGFFTVPPPADRLVEAPIESVAVWDTVGSLGIPEYAATGRLDLFRFADTRLSPIVASGFQAIAIDEEREDFTPTLWDSDPRIVQALFPGAHADIGGGYPDKNRESALSDITLGWVTASLTSKGMLFAPTPAFVARPDARGTAHAPWLHAPWTMLRRRPRDLPEGLVLAQAVLARMRAAAVVADPDAAPAAYRPSNLGLYVAGTEPALGIVVV